MVHGTIRRSNWAWSGATRGPRDSFRGATAFPSSADDADVEDVVGADATTEIAQDISLASDD